MCHSSMQTERVKPYAAITLARQNHHARICIKEGQESATASVHSIAAGSGRCVANIVPQKLSGAACAKTFNQMRRICGGEQGAGGKTRARARLS